MWQEQGEAEDLDSAIRGLEKIYGLKSDWYNGINLAFLLNARAASGGADDPQTDAMQASWIRRRVIKACEAELADRKDEFDVAVDERDEKVRESQYWLLATLREAAFGLGDDAQAEHWANEANATKPPGWMLSSTEDQLGVLAGYLAATSPPDSP
jgi:hypothetical protein